MVRDFRKIGLQAKPAERRDPLTEAIRTGLPSPSGPAGAKLAVDKLAGTQPMGIDAPTKGLRKLIAGGSELHSVLEYGFGAVFFLLLGVACCYLALSERFDLNIFGFGIGSLALGAFLLRSALRALRNLRSISRA